MGGMSVYFFIHWCAMTSFVAVGATLIASSVAMDELANPTLDPVWVKIVKGGSSMWTLSGCSGAHTKRVVRLHIQSPQSELSSGADTDTGGHIIPLLVRDESLDSYTRALSDLLMMHKIMENTRVLHLPVLQGCLTTVIKAVDYAHEELKRFDHVVIHVDPNDEITWDNTTNVEVTLGSMISTIGSNYKTRYERINGGGAVPNGSPIFNTTGDLCCLNINPNEHNFQKVVDVLRERHVDKVLLVNENNTRISMLTREYISGMVKRMLGLPVVRYHDHLSHCLFCDCLEHIKQELAVDGYYIDIEHSNESIV